MSSRRAATAAAAALLVGGCDARVDRLPDWSGQWENVGATPSPDGGFYESLEQVLKELEWSPPLKPDSQAAIDRVVEIQRKAMAAMRDGIDPGGAVTACTFGFPTIMLESPLMFEILPTPKETALIFSSREIRHVYTDGRDHPPEGDVWPTPWGDSVGHWEGDTLVIETRNLNGKTWLDELGGVVTHQEQVVERFIPVDGNNLRYEATVTDPGAYTRPWTLAMPLRRQNSELLEVACLEDDQDLKHLKDIRDAARAAAKKQP